MKRREFIKNTIIAGSAMAMGGSALAGVGIGQQAYQQSENKFKLKYAPHFGMFKHHAGENLIDELQFMYDAGFRALEDNGMKDRSVEEQEKIAKKMAQLGMEMGVFVVYTGWGNSGMAAGKKEEVDVFLKNVTESVEVAKRVNAKWMTVVCGEIHPNLDMDYQMANVVNALKRGAEIFEKHNLTMVLEPLNWRDHPKLFLTKISQAYLICKSVNSKAVKILDDLYHQQVTEGNLIPNLDMAWDEIAYIQLGDNPGRNEPTTGEINFKNVFKHLHNKNFTGIVGMEHGISGQGKEGEKALIKAYTEVDNF